MLGRTFYNHIDLSSIHDVSTLFLKVQYTFAFLSFSNLAFHANYSCCPPSSSISDFNTNFFHLVNSVSNPCIILGDLNINTISPVKSADGIDFTDRFSCLGCDSLIKIPTRKISSTATCIDHIYVKFTTSIKSGVLGMNVSNHGAIFCS